VTYLGAAACEAQGTKAQGLATRFRSSMRVVPTVKWYSPDTGTIDRIYWNGADRTVTSTEHTSRETTGQPVIGASQAIQGCWGHWTADARIPA
jgi:hypothetical protein